MDVYERLISNTPLVDDEPDYALYFYESDGTCVNCGASTQGAKGGGGFRCPACLIQHNRRKNEEEWF